MEVAYQIDTTTIQDIKSHLDLGLDYFRDIILDTLAIVMKTDEEWLTERVPEQKEDSPLKSIQECIDILHITR